MLELPAAYVWKVSHNESTAIHTLKTKAYDGKYYLMLFKHKLVVITVDITV